MKILFCSVESDGLLFPAIAVARALVRRGHEVAFVTDVSRAADLEAAGLQRISRGQKDGASFEIRTWFYPIPIAIQVKHIEYALSIFPADVLVGQPLTIGPYIVRDRIGLPLAVLGLASPIWPTDPKIVERPPKNKTEERHLGRHSEMMHFYSEARKLFQLAPRNEDFVHSPLLGDVYLAQTVPELWAARGCLAERIHGIGSCLWEPAVAHHEVDDWLASGAPSKPLIYAQFGRSFLHTDPTQKFFSSVQEEHFRVAASIGRSERAPETIADSFFVRDLVPQERVLPQVDVVVCSGNSTVMLGALTHGLPLLILYGEGEQPDVAEICAATGAAIARPVADVTEAEIRECLHRLLDEKCFRLHAQQIQRAFAGYGGPRSAAHHIIALAAESSAHGSRAGRVATAN